MNIKSLLRTFLMFGFFFSTHLLFSVASFACSCFSVSPFSQEAIEKSQYEPFDFETFLDWKHVCMRIRTKEKTRHGKLTHLIKNAKFKDRCLSKNEFKKTLKKFINMTKQGPFLRQQNWIDGKAPDKKKLVIGEDHLHCMFFAQKYIVCPKAEISIHADLHGDIHSLIKYLNYLFLEGKIDKFFKLTDKNFYLVFLGDYVDGWLYGSEVFYTLLRLKLANPKNVILLRGNHEDLVQNKRHGFKEEFFKKFSYEESKKEQKFCRLGIIYNLLPAVVYLGVPSDDEKFINYVLLCHGGLEPRFNPHRLLLKKGNCLYQWIYEYDISWFKDFPDNVYSKYVSHTSCSKTIGFMWNDFVVEDNGKKQVIKSHRKHPGLFKFTKEMTKSFLQACSCEQKYKVRFIVRGHQHSHKPLYKELSEHNGIYNMWANKQWDGESPIKIDEQSIVWTLNVSPHALNKSFFKKWPFRFDIHAVLKVDKKFRNWVFQPKKLESM